MTTLEIAGDTSPVDWGRLNDDVKGLVNYMTDDLREFKRQAQENAKTSADGLISTAFDRQKIRREVTSSFGTATAKFSDEITAARGPNSAIVQQLTQQKAELGTKASASALNAVTNRVTESEGNISSLSQ